MSRQSHSNAEIQALIANFSKQLETLIRRSTLEQVVDELSSQMGFVPKRGRGRPQGSRNVGFKKTVKRGPGGRRSPDYLVKLGERLLSHVKSHPGQRGEQIAAALKTNVGTIRLPMQKLIAAKKIKTMGQRRGMTYTAS